jgi:RNA recognition motif. (a.k.a. RRM, RBD, or RNP domain)
MEKMESMREAQIQAYLRWFKKYRWAWFCTLKITSGIPSDRRARDSFDNWISELRQLEAGEDFRWARVLERGPTGGNRHFHILVGGLRNRLKFWGERWNELGGDALISRYDPEQNGILYLLKSMSERGDLEIDFELPEEKKPGGGTRTKLQEESRTSDSGTAKVRVDGIDDLTTPAELTQLFKRYGRVLEANVVQVRINSDRNALYATVGMEDAVAADNAMEELDGLGLRGREIRVSPWRSERGNDIYAKGEE